MRYFLAGFFGVCAGMLLAGAANADSGLQVQSYGGTAPVTTATARGDVLQQLQTLRTKVAPPRPAAAMAPPHEGIPNAAYYDSPRQGAEGEYRGYNGRNQVQAYMSCKYESFRAATPGDNSRPVLQKMRMRLYVMDACMNREGFFRSKPLPAFDLSLLTSGDIFKW